MPERPAPPAAPAAPAQGPGEPAAQALKVTLVYAASAALWILFSDSLLEAWFRDPAQLALAGAVKGWLFTAVTAALLYGLLRRGPWRGGAVPPGPGRRGVLARLALALGLTAAVTAAAIAYSTDRNRQVELVRLKAVADLKVEQLTDWLHERSTEAGLVQAGADAAALYGRWRQSGDSPSRDLLLARLRELLPLTQFQAISLLDESGQLLWHSSSQTEVPDAATRSERQRIARQRDVQRHGPHLDARGHLNTDIVLPLVAPGLRDGEPAALLVFHLDDSRYLPPRLREWPVPSQTGEVVLVRREGDQVLYLSSLREDPHAALRLRKPLSQDTVLASQIIASGSGGIQVLSGTNYRGTGAFGVGRAVPGTDWYLLAEMGHTELYATATKEALWIVLAGALALFVMASALYLSRQREQLALAQAAQQAQADRLHVLGLLSALADASDDAIFAKDLTGRYTLFNRAAARFVGRPADTVMGLDDNALFPPEQARVIMEADRRALVDDRVITQEEFLSTPDGDRVFLATKGPLRDATGKVLGVFGISRDITRLKQSELALRRANRALLASRECGQAVMRADDVVGLLREICRIVVETGGYCTAWAGLAEDDATCEVRPVAQSGPGVSDLQAVGLSWAADALGSGPTGGAIRPHQPVVVHDILSDPACAPWHDVALKHGFMSSIAVPLMTDAQTCFGALCIYAGEAAAFDDEEIRLLAELANDVAYGMRALRDRRARRHAEQLLREQKDRLAESQHMAGVGSWQIDVASGRLRWSDETYRLHDLRPDTFVPTPDATLQRVQEPDREAVRAWLQSLLAGAPVPDIEYHCLSAERGLRTLQARGVLETGRDGAARRVVGTVQDVTALRQAEAARLAQEARYRELFASNPHPMWVLDKRSLAFLEVNDAAVAKYGWSRDEFLAMTIDDIRSPEEALRLREYLRSRPRDQGSIGIWRHRLKAGSEILVEVSTHSLDFGGRSALVVLAHDVTAQQQAEAALLLQARRAEALLRLPEMAEQMDEAAFMQGAQALAVDLTDSCSAFIQFIGADGQAIAPAGWSHPAPAGRCQALHGHHLPIVQAGVWADALRERKPQVVNAGPGQPDGPALPPGHAPLQRLVMVPVIERGKVAMLAGVGGKAADYSSLDVETVQLISNETWRLVQRRRAGAALLESEQNYRTLTEQVPAIIYRAAVDETSSTVYISPAVQSLGYSADEWLADPSLWLKGLHPDDRERVLDHLRAAKQLGRGIDIEYRLRHRDGGWRHFHDKAELVRNAAGQAVCLQGLMLDITQRMHDQTELRKLYQAVEQSPNSIVITNLKAEIEYVNEAFLATTGYTREEVLGRNPRILHADGGSRAEHQAMWQALTHGLPWRGVFNNRRKDGSTFLEFAHVAPLRQPDGSITHYVGVKEDITEKTRIAGELDRYRQRLEELVEERTADLAVARRRAEAANRAKSAFLANMSHEIRTPMNAIVGLSYLLQRDDATPRQALRLAKIDAAALHLLSLINDVLDLSKIEAGKVALELSDFALHALMEEAHALIADRALAKGVTVQVQSEGLPDWLHGDTTRLRQALFNYADNALKFTEAGRIWLRARRLDERADAVLVRFEVQDTGIGIEPGQLPMLFQAFEQADTSTTRRFGGTGLGLALTRRLAALMDGETGVDSVPGVGSTFWLTAWLQRAQAPAGHAAVAEAGGAESALRQHCAGARVLLVEDDAVNREVATELLHATGIHVDTADDGHQAVQRVTAGDYDLVLMDVQMPGMDGFEATRQLRAQPPLAGLPILALTANAFEEDRQACLDAGMNDFVSKPVDPTLLYATLLRWLPRRTLPGAMVAPVAEGLPASERETLLAQLHAVDGLDAERGLATLRGDLPVYLRLLQGLADNHADAPANLLQHLQAGRLDTAQQLAHRLKGAAAALGAGAVQGAAAALEAALRAARPDAPLQALAQSLGDECDHLFPALRQLPGLSAAPDTTLPDADRARSVLARLEPLVASDDTAAGEFFDLHRRLLTVTLGAEAIKLGQQLEAFDYPAALRTLRSLLTNAPA